MRAAGELPAADIVDVLPTLLALGGVPVPEALDGRPIGAAVEAPARLGPDPVPVPAGRPLGYDRADERDVRDRLTALGYLEPGA